MEDTGIHSFTPEPTEHEAAQTRAQNQQWFSRSRSLQDEHLVFISSLNIKVGQLHPGGNIRVFTITSLPVLFLGAGGGISLPSSRRYDGGNHPDFIQCWVSSLMSVIPGGNAARTVTICDTRSQSHGTSHSLAT